MKLSLILPQVLLLQQLCAAAATVSAAASSSDDEESSPVPITTATTDTADFSEIFSNNGILPKTTKKRRSTLSVEEYVASVQDWTPKQDEGVLPIGLSPEEEFVVALDRMAGGTYDAAAPKKTKRKKWKERLGPKPVMIPEWENMQGVLIAYPLGISLNLVAALHARAKIFCLLQSRYSSRAERDFRSVGIQSDEVEWIYGNTDSYWTRDYGPWFVSSTRVDRGIAIINHEYNRPRPNDDDAPRKVAEAMGIAYYDSGMVGCGGNMMVDGTGQAIATHIAYTENDRCNTNDDDSVPLPPCRFVNNRMKRAYGVQTFHVVADPSNEYIDHVDCWAKYLSPSKIMIREVSASHPQHDEIEEVVQYFAGTQTAEGENWEIVRIWTDSDQPYTNSLILNGEVFVPIVGSAWDDDALQTYEDAMPDYVVTGWTGSWASTDALHCRTRGIPAFQD